MPGFIAALRALAAAKAAKAATGAKVFFTVMEVADLGLTATNVGIEIAKAVNDPPSQALQDAANAYAAAGLEYDQRVARVDQANGAIQNLQTGISSLSDIHIDYGDKLQLAMDMMERLDDLRDHLNTLNPTLFSWYNGTATSASHKAGLNAVEAARLNEVKESLLAVDWETIAAGGLFIGALAVQAGRALFKRRTRNAAPAPAPPPSAPTAAPAPSRADPFAGVGGEAVSLRRAALKVRRQQWKNRARVAGRYAGIGFNHALTLGSFAMNVVALVNRAQAEAQAIEDFNMETARYRAEIPTFDLALNGAKTQADQDRVISFFGLSVDTEAGRESLAIGYNGVIGQTNETIEETIDDIGACYDEMITAFEGVLVRDDEAAMIEQLRTSKREVYTPARLIALDTSLSAEKRKVDGIDKIRDEFILQLSGKLNIILDTLSETIENFTALNLFINTVEEVITEKKGLDSDVCELVAEGLPEQRAREIIFRNIADKITDKARAALVNMNIGAAGRSILKEEPAVKTLLQQVVDGATHHNDLTIRGQYVWLDGEIRSGRYCRPAIFLPSGRIS